MLGMTLTNRVLFLDAVNPKRDRAHREERAPKPESSLGTVERTALNSFCGCGGETMKGRILAELFLCSLFFVVGGDAKSPDTREKPVSDKAQSHAARPGFGRVQVLTDPA